jgi:hypothetical protein
MNSDDGNVIDVVPRADRADVELRAVEDRRRDLHREPRVGMEVCSHGHLPSRDLTEATRPPVICTRSAGVSLKTVFG